MDRRGRKGERRGGERRGGERRRRDRDGRDEKSRDMKDGALFLQLLKGEGEGRGRGERREEGERKGYPPDPRVFGSINKSDKAMRREWREKKEVPHAPHHQPNK
jgi:hypothetical protein